MEWMQRMKKILDYMEEHLTDSIDMKQIEKFSCCSSYNFQRVFSFCMDISLAEYIRNRKMSEAANELRHTDSGILDIAIKYGYQSQEAFSRAFVKFHGITPKQARDTHMKLNYYPNAAFLYKEDIISMNQQETSQYLLERRPTAEQFKNKAPSPITLNFPVSMLCYMEYMGQNTNTMQNYTLIANLCGDTYNTGLELTKDSGIVTALQTLGYSLSICSTKERDTNYVPEDKLRERIIHELVVNKRPIIAVNVVDCCFGGVVVGYQEDGACLLNWGFFPFDASDDPQPIITECRDWYKKTQKVVFIEKNPDCQLDLKNVYIEALKKAHTYLGTKEELKTEHLYKEWRHQLLENDTEVNNDFSLIDPMWCDFAEKRFYAGQFMLQLKNFLSNKEDKLNHLWNIFGREMNDLMYEYISLVDLKPGEECSSTNWKKFNDPNVRQQMCKLIDECELKEREAAKLISELI